MSKPLQVPATVEGISTLKDGGVSIRLHTQELTADEKAVAFNYQGQFGWFLFKESEHKSEDVERLEAVRKDTGGKSPSQRMRAVIYKLYEQSGDKSISFENYYDRTMERILNQLKEKLN